MVDQHHRSFLIGLLMTLLTERSPAASQSGASLLVVGFLGGYTTFSSFEWETFSPCARRILDRPGQRSGQRDVGLRRGLVGRAPGPAVKPPAHAGAPFFVRPPFTYAL